MPRAILPIVVLLGVTHLGGCGGDDTVNPSNPEAGATAPKDASSSDAAKPSEGGSEAGKEGGSDASGGAAEAATNAPAGHQSADAS